MNKSQFVATIARTGSECYRVVVDETWCNDLIDDGLIPQGRRRKNDGKHPIYEFDDTATKRALRIIRLRKCGIVRKDALRVHLFLREKDFPVWDVREALYREYCKAAKSLNNQIRSGYADNQKAIGPKHKEKLIRQLGSLDFRFKANLSLSDDLYIAAVRASKQRQLQPLPGIASGNGFTMERNLEFETLARLMVEPFMSGALMLGSIENAAPAEGTMESLCCHSDDQTYRHARAIFLSFIVGLSKWKQLLPFMISNVESESQNSVGRAIASASMCQPEFSAWLLVWCLRLAKQNPGLADTIAQLKNCKNLLNLLRSFDGTAFGGMPACP